ncbi:MAG: hypothetical protein NT096_09580 [Proteobacteria bacterium]|nr:hypothetical protein [Pseudomonadota bacterium]
MINLRAMYGNKIFDRKVSYRNAQYIPYIASLSLDIIIAWAIVRIFDVRWDYAFIKVYAILLLYEILKYIFSSSIDFLNYKLTIKSAMSSEIRHYLNLFNNSVNWDEVGTYDDFLLEVAFNETLSTDLRVLAAINYGTIVDAMSLSPHFENRSYKLFYQIVPDYIKSGDYEKGDGSN